MEIGPGCRVVVLNGRHFPAFAAGDEGTVLRVDAEAQNCQVLFAGRTEGVQVALRHLRACSRSPSAAAAASAQPPSRCNAGGASSSRMGASSSPPDRSSRERSGARARQGHGEAESPNAPASDDGWGAGSRGKAAAHQERPRSQGPSRGTSPAPEPLSAARVPPTARPAAAAAAGGGAPPPLTTIPLQPLAPQGLLGYANGVEPASAAAADAGRAAARLEAMEARLANIEDEHRAEVSGLRHALDECVRAIGTCARAIDTMCADSAEALRDSGQADVGAAFAGDGSVGEWERAAAALHDAASLGMRALGGAPTACRPEAAPPKVSLEARINGGGGGSSASGGTLPVRRLYSGATAPLNPLGTEYALCPATLVQQQVFSSPISPRGGPSRCSSTPPPRGQQPAPPGSGGPCPGITAATNGEAQRRYLVASPGATSASGAPAPPVSPGACSAMTAAAAGAAGTSSGSAAAGPPPYHLSAAMPCQAMPPREACQAMAPRQVSRQSLGSNASVNMRGPVGSGVTALQPNLQPSVAMQNVVHHCSPLGVHVLGGMPPQHLAPPHPGHMMGSMRGGPPLSAMMPCLGPAGVLSPPQPVLSGRRSLGGPGCGFPAPPPLFGVAGR